MRYAVGQLESDEPTADQALAAAVYRVWRARDVVRKRGVRPSVEVLFELDGR